MVHNIADITPNSVVTALKSSRTPANWVQVTAPAGNSGSMRIGDSTTSASSGLEVIKGTTAILLPIGDDQYLDLALVYVYGTSTDKVSILYGTH